MSRKESEYKNDLIISFNWFKLKESNLFDTERISMEKTWQAMDAIFKPDGIAIIGASDNPGKLGSHVLRSLLEGRYPGKIFPVNPGKPEILGIKAYPSLLHVPGPVDLSIVVLPSEQIPQTILECPE